MFGISFHRTDEASRPKYEFYLKIPDRNSGAAGRDPIDRESEIGIVLAEIAFSHLPSHEGIARLGFGRSRPKALFR